MIETMIQERIKVEISYINNLYERYIHGENKAKFLLVLYIREFELNIVSLHHANIVMGWMEEHEI